MRRQNTATGVLVRSPSQPQRRFAFVKNPNRQLTCVSVLRLALAAAATMFSILEFLLNSRYGFTWHSAASGFLYALASVTALIGSTAQDMIRRRRFLWLHSWISIGLCLLVYPAEIGLLALELCQDTAWCLCGPKRGQLCPQNWRVVPVELSAMFSTTVVFVFNLLAAVLSRKLWKSAETATRRTTTAVVRTPSVQRTLKRAKLEADECLATNFHQQIQQKQQDGDDIFNNQKPQIYRAASNAQNQQPNRRNSNRRRQPAALDRRFGGGGVLSAAAATVTAAASAPAFCYGGSRTVVDQLNRPARRMVEGGYTNELVFSGEYWWRSKENFV